MARIIRAVALDVDGVLTDGTVWLGPADAQWKRVAFLDVMGVSRARRAGLRFALISGEDGAPLQAVASKFGITDVWGGCKDKSAALEDFAARHGLDVAAIAFVGDDINDVDALRRAGLGVAPANAHRTARDAARLTTRAAGGAGAVRELLDALVAAEWDAERVIATWSAA
ncbi:MAG: HAD family hydrolase [Gemmatimonadaceae bacterium]|nr:HAD family hydrolase [Gemmatimonadaceae bacterium]